ncbi:hypothetical protein [Azospirillum canadense]|uniref:hypothetical protein n=1 Tax=Azospirillum canadense TaxID=403962 RepID=UPI002227459B|nr:hypothetical protein [Azospirillum canadense]MCW2240973.1 hypothetical protein [Azospirillum canadense]
MVKDNFAALLHSISGLADVPAPEPLFDPYNTGVSYLPIWDPYGYVGPSSGSIYDPGLGPIYDPYDLNANIYQTLPDSPLSGF